MRKANTSNFYILNLFLLENFRGQDGFRTMTVVVQKKGEIFWGKMLICFKEIGNLGFSYGNPFFITFVRNCRKLGRYIFQISESANILMSCSNCSIAENLQRVGH